MSGGPVERPIKVGGFVNLRGGDPAYVFMVTAAVLERGEVVYRLHGLNCLYRAEELDVWRGTPGNLWPDLAD